MSDNIEKKNNKEHKMKFKKYDIYKIIGNQKPTTAKECELIIEGNQATKLLSLIKQPVTKEIWYLNPETNERQQYLNFKKYGLKEDKNEIIYIRSSVKVNEIYTKYLITNFKNKTFITHQYLI